ncbi:hypothetical protein [Undibacterium oligocarboniphilum]|uniref:Uncharacterized protein n=1 Tax=Undibacterium oligocarboniphilum TaxID=666702 RepID=A0A850QIK6_9BURK|nr:hypothetical protein [Undibacterium oligocarboniphilum]MBC3868620.1 hypothetical protein [Undibacterium oligocarboniphilum]NVO76600.1 hypothetical protein [Undibacterium oligocarboniphilum]
MRHMFRVATVMHGHRFHAVATGLHRAFLDNLGRNNSCRCHEGQGKGQKHDQDKPKKSHIQVL